jgi:hypothetical protein
MVTVSQREEREMHKKERLAPVPAGGATEHARLCMAWRHSIRLQRNQQVWKDLYGLHCRALGAIR